MVEPRATFQRPAHLIAYPYLSLAERDRRWQATWQAMEDQNLDCVLVPPAIAPSKLCAAARYLTHVGGWDETRVAAILPLGAPPIVIVPQADEWRQMQPWCGNLQEPDGDFTTALVAKLREASLPRRKVGVVGLRDTDGEVRLVNHDLMKALVEDLELACDDFTAQMDSLRATKSAEEIAFVEQSARIANQGLRHSAATIRLGMTERELWATLLESTLSLGSDAPVRIRQGSGKPMERLSSVPGPRTIGPGWTSLMSLETAWGGYRARCAQPISVNPPAPSEMDLMSLTAEIWNSLARAIKPDIPTHMIQASVDQAAGKLQSRRGPLRSVSVAVSIRGCGLGKDEPTASYRGPKPLRETPHGLIGKDSCLFLGVRTSSDSQQILWGDSVVVTANGVRRLGNNPQSILTP